MKNSHLLAVAAVAAAVAAAVSAAAQQPAAGGWEQPKTPWGDPDLQGVWRYEASVPLERPAQLQGRAALTDEEVAKNQKLEDDQAAQRLAGAEGAAVGRRSVGESPIRGNEYNSFWQDHGRPRQVYKQTSLVIDPADGRIPYTPDAKKAEARAQARYGAGPYESFLDPDTGERCLTDGVTALMWQGPNGGHNRIVQSPGYVTVLHEEYLDRRVIPVDGRQPHGVRQWFGNAVGKWEGNTFVVTTTNFIDRTNYEWASIFMRPSETLRMSERYTRTGPSTMDYRITVEDPTTFERAWTAQIPITRLPDDTLIYEYACHEGNYAMTNLLAGGRADAAKRGR
ncbi:MAG TPA: hypothetical protein VFO31_04240 [Vicinamibacterales bacterium]|nr:hypothetical protein [Vicinamibacterales bacterium]